MPVPKSEFDDLRPLEFHDPEEVLDPDEMYTVYEIARLFQGLDPAAELDAETEAILLDWTIPWIVENTELFVFAEPAADDEAGLYGLDEDAAETGDEATDRADSRGESGDR